MASLIPGYEYDIFISYRQKDNKHDGWVTEFVDNLKGELESTFKEEISVYFDINPHDGLLETHDVDASLKEKLKCLIFIPIISRTYCDPKSFAWEHEFKVFVELALQDQFGLKVKLPNGNVANRVLPVQIRDLNKDDRKLVESEFGGYMRGIEFIYKESGVNRPLIPEDDEKKNLANTKYRNQINKVANAISGVIDGLRSPVGITQDASPVSIKEIPSGTATGKTKLIASSLILMVLVIVGYFIISKLNKPTEQLEKSIAVLPFINDSPNDSTTYFINGIMEEVLNNLQKIKEFRILSRTSTDQYRGTSRPTIREIAKKLGVNYIVEGSGQKYGNTFRVRVQLIEANHERHLWAESYEQEIKEPKDIFRVQSQIAQEIASVLKVIITPEEKQIIEKAPTISLTAYNYYLKGIEQLWKFGIGSLDRPSIKRAEILFKQALENDSTFARGYVGLGYVYWKKAYYEENYSKHFRDSMLLFANIALSYDDKLAEAYVIRAGCYAETRGNLNMAIEELDKAIRFNPNLWEAYHEKGKYYWWDGDLLREIENHQKAASLNHGAQLPELLTTIGNSFISAGFTEKANYYYHEAFKLQDDSVTYLYQLASVESAQGNYKKSLEFLEKINAIDSTSEGLDLRLALDYMYAGQFEKSLKYVKKWVDRLKASGESDSTEMHRIGFIYWVNGYKKEAKYYFETKVEFCLANIKKYGPSAILAWYFNNHYDLAGVYAFRGDKEKAYKNLRISNQRKSFDFFMGTFIKNDPLFDSIRNEPEFQQIVSEVEAKYQAEHERVRKWLEKQAML